jgi:hypothetical protein
LLFFNIGYACAEKVIPWESTVRTGTITLQRSLTLTYVMTKQEFRRMYPGVAWDYGYHFDYLVAELCIDKYRCGEIHLQVMEPDPASFYFPVAGTRRLRIKEYLQLIPEPATREKALKNLYGDYGNEWALSLPKALYRAFLWHRSPEGFDYWQQVHKTLSADNSQSL